LIETVSVTGVVALAGETLSQELVDAAATKESAAPALETEMLCAAGGGDPGWRVKVSEAGDTARFTAGPIFVTKASKSPPRAA